MEFDFVGGIATYSWNEENTIPFIWKCLCGSKTTLVEHDITKTYECSNKDCKWKLRFI